MRGQAERLLPMLEEVLRERGVAWGDLDGLGVCVGPGNFTGLRLGVAAARGLALALDVPAIGISRLEALAADRPGPVLVTLDANRDRLFAQDFEDGVPLAEPVMTTLAALDPRPAKTVCVGFAAQAIAARMGLAAGPEADNADTGVLARLAAMRLDRPQPRPAPLYLRPPDAAPSAAPLPVLIDDA